MTQHVVVGPLAVVKDNTGRQVYVYQGGTLPDGVSDDDVARLQASGLIAAPAALIAQPTADPDETLVQQTAVLGDDPTAVARPATVASKTQWVDYAVSQGASQDEAESMTKADLVAAYGE